MWLTTHLSTITDYTRTIFKKKKKTSLSFIKSTHS